MALNPRRRPARLAEIGPLGLAEVDNERIETKGRITKTPCEAIWHLQGFLCLVV